MTFMKEIEGAGKWERPCFKHSGEGATDKALPGSPGNGISEEPPCGLPGLKPSRRNAPQKAALEAAGGSRPGVPAPAPP